jgi:hypothetical protein
VIVNASTISTADAKRQPRRETPHASTQTYLRPSRLGSFDRNFDMVEALEKVGADAGISLLHVAIGGLAAQPRWHQ